MRSIPILLVLAAFPLCFFGQHKDQRAIRELLDRQTVAWNKGDISQFMVGYWENDSLMYIGQSGVTYGYEKTLSNYKKNYSDTAKMGKLAFNLMHINKISPKAYFVVGKWHLTRSIGDTGGHFLLIFRKMKGKWVVVADHSS